jgi:L-amino acid N-acyltransferase YncA
VTTSLRARPAELEDAPAIAAIYSQGIEDRIATFETEPRSAEAVEGVLRQGDRYPAVVVEEGGGRLVLEALISEAERRGFWKLLSRIFPENAASRRLCATLGFREVGVYHRHGRLEGRWMDCVIVERLLGAAARD